MCGKPDIEKLFTIAVRSHSMKCVKFLLQKRIIKLTNRIKMIIRKETKATGIDFSQTVEDFL